jgi:hypothetical protein
MLIFSLAMTFAGYLRGAAAALGHDLLRRALRRAVLAGHGHHHRGHGDRRAHRRSWGRDLHPRHRPGRSSSGSPFPPGRRRSTPGASRRGSSGSPWTRSPRRTADPEAPGKMGPVPGTVVLVAIFFVAFVVYYFANWALLSFTWRVGEPWMRSRIGRERGGGPWSAPPPERSTGLPLTLAALAAVLLMTVGWWALALWPVPGDPGVARAARAVCFNAGGPTASRTPPGGCSSSGSRWGCSGSSGGLAPGGDAGRSGPAVRRPGGARGARRGPPRGGGRAGRGRGAGGERRRRPGRRSLPFPSSCRVGASPPGPGGSRSSGS